MRNIYTIERGARNISIKRWEIYYFKIKIILFIIILEETMPFVIDKFKFKKELQYQKNLPYLTEVRLLRDMRPWSQTL